MLSAQKRTTLQHMKVQTKPEKLCVKLMKIQIIHPRVNGISYKEDFKNCDHQKSNNEYEDIFTMAHFNAIHPLRMSKYNNCFQFEMKYLKFLR